MVRTLQWNIQDNVKDQNLKMFNTVTPFGAREKYSGWCSVCRFCFTWYCNGGLREGGRRYPFAWVREVVVGV